MAAPRETSWQRRLLPGAALRPEPRAREIPQDPLADIRDDVDTQVLPIFLEEAAELYPQAGERVRAWRRAPGDDTRARQLRRTLHTFKGSARMAGAMRLGELVHLMESRLDLDDSPVSVSTDLFERSTRSRPHRVRARCVARREDQRRPSWARTGTRPPRGGTRRHAVADASAEWPSERTSSFSLPSPDVRLSARVGRGCRSRAGARAMLRVRADIIDRLVNEAGEVAIARARIESELRALKAALFELPAT